LERLTKFWELQVYFSMLYFIMILFHYGSLMLDCFFLACAIVIEYKEIIMKAL